MPRSPKQTSSTVQPLSIQYIDLEKTRGRLRLTKDEFKKTKFEIVAEKIIDLYNETKQSNKSETFSHMPQKIKSLKGYTVRIYEKVQSMKPRLVKKMEQIGQKNFLNNRKTEFVVFCFRKDPKEIFALTTGQAWRAVRSCVDYRFPNHIAERMLDCKRVTKIVRRCLIGPDVKQTLVNTAGFDFYQTENLYHLVESFESQVKAGSSFMDLELTTNRPQVTVSTGVVNVHCQLPFEKYSKIIELFSDYFHGKKPLEEADPGFQFLHYLQPAQVDSKDLNEKLIKKVWENYSQRKEQIASFRHKNLDDYLSATEFQLIQPLPPKEHLLPEEPPSLEEIIDYLISELSELEEMDGNILLRELKTWKLKYFSRGDFHACPLMECIEGEVRHKNKTYFRTRNMWYELTVDFERLLYADYRDFLKQALLPKGHEGTLPHAWAGNGRKGYLTQKLVQEKLQITKGIRKFMEKLTKTKVSFLDNDRRVLQKHLVGEILKVPVIITHKSRIDVLLASQNRISEREFAESFRADANAVMGELKKVRPVLKPVLKREQKFVLNPFIYPLRNEPFLQGQKYQIFTQFLEQMCAINDNVEDEESYNRSYLYKEDGTKYGPKDGYLVLDQILPNNIELCDIVHYTPSTTYLHCVKEELGQDTRIVCSQMLNAAKELRSALSTNDPNSYLKELWKDAVSYNLPADSWRRGLRDQLRHLGEKVFFDLFFERKIVFVYSFLGNPKRSLHDEIKKSMSVSLDFMGSQEEQDSLSQTLLEEGFIDERGRLTGKFMATSKRDFVLQDEDDARSQEVYDQLKAYAPQSKSTIAKLELIRLSQELRNLNFDLKICEIKPKNVGVEDSMEEDGDDLSPPPIIPPPRVPLSREFSDISPPSSPTSQSQVSQSPDLGRRIRNIGNSCYIAATLQVMFNIPEICERIESQALPGNLVNGLKKAFDSRDVDVRSLRGRIFNGQNASFRPERITAQQDAHELLLYFLNELGRDLDLSVESVALNGRASFQSLLDQHFADDEGRLLPSYFIVQLKRFRNIRNRTSKDETGVRYPNDRCVNIVSGDETALYDIVGYVNHVGSLSEGHYTADIFQNDRWLHCNDDEIIERAPQNPETRAYLIVLKKRN